MSDKSLPDNCDILNLQIDAPYFQPLYDAPIPIFIARENGRFLMINRAVQEATGFSCEEIPTVEAWVRHLEGDPAEEIEKRFNGFFKAQDALKPLRVWVKTKSGQSLIWEFFIAPLGRTTDGERMIISLASDARRDVDHERDLEAVMARLEQEMSKRTKDLNATIIALENEIAERKHISEALSNSRERLRLMSRRTLNVLEADRRTVSKELHDGIGASLAAIKFSLEVKEMKRAKNNGRLDDSLTQEIAYLVATIKESKRISANLRPTTLDDLGLMATIKWYLRQFRRMYGNIRVQYTTDITEADVPDAMKIIIYRIVQEGLSNAEKHGEASSIRLHMGFSEDRSAITLFIEDDGRGFDVEEALSKKDPLSGYGLIAMRERCEIFGGSFRIESRIGAGTIINSVFPIKSPAPGDSAPGDNS